MMREADPYQVELVSHPLGVPVEELGRDPLGWSEYPAQRADQS
jgi:hypothetical protein